MRTASLTLVVTLGGVLLVVSAIGCGGGGGNGPGPGTSAGPVLFSGDYHAVSLLMDASGGPVLALTEWGVVTGDGVGGLTGSVMNNANEVPGGPVPMPAGSTYLVSPARAFEFRPGGAALASGGISGDGRAAAVAIDQAGSQPGISIFAKRQGTFTIADLSGPYHLCGFFFDTGPDVDIGLYGTMTFTSGTGTCTGAFPFNDGGTINPPTTLSGTYTVDPDGTTSLSVSGADWKGGMLLGGELVILAGSTNAGSPNFLIILVKHSTAATTATLNGNYYFVGIEADSGGGYDCNTGTALVAAGTLTANMTRNNDGVITTEGPNVATYTVTTNGTLTLATGDTLIGGVAPSGNFATFGGGASAGSNPLIYFMHR